MAWSVLLLALLAAPAAPAPTGPAETLLRVPRVPANANALRLVTRGLTPKQVEQLIGGLREAYAKTHLQAALRALNRAKKGWPDQLRDNPRLAREAFEALCKVSRAGAVPGRVLQGLGRGENGLRAVRTLGALLDPPAVPGVEKLLKQLSVGNARWGWLRAKGARYVLELASELRRADIVLEAAVRTPLTRRFFDIVKKGRAVEAKHWARLPKKAAEIINDQWSKDIAYHLVRHGDEFGDFFEWSIKGIARASDDAKAIQAHMARAIANLDVGRVLSDVTGRRRKELEAVIKALQADPQALIDRIVKFAA